jgi:xylulokinase
MSEDLVLGFDLSTQSVTAVLLEVTSSAVVLTESINFDVSLPKFKTQNGMHVGPHGRVTSPVMMWLEALDKLLARLAATGLLPRVVAVSGKQYKLFQTLR